MSTSADLTLKLRVVLQLDRIYLQRIVALLITADHRIPIETAQRSSGAQPKVVACPLQNSLLVDHATRKRYAGADHRDLILWLHCQMLFDESVKGMARAEAEELAPHNEHEDGIMWCEGHFEIAALRLACEASGIGRV